MISYEQAYEVAKKNKPGIDFCTEMTDAYIFIEKEFADCEGGPGSPCVVLKENGKAINMPYYVAVYNGSSKKVREFDI